MDTNQSQQLPVHILEWFYLRGITDDVLKRYKISYNGTHIVIPICDIKGRFLFNKYRRDPQTDIGPKYNYDKGGTTQLFNIEDAVFKKDVFICEGELDALALISKGYVAVSGTGGSGVFKKEWASYFVEKNVYICYDNDDAGWKGAYNVQAKIPWAKIIWITHGKDVTEYLQLSEGINFPKLIESANTWHVPERLTILPKTKKELAYIIDMWKREVDVLMQQALDLRSLNASDAHIKVLVNHYVTLLAEAKRSYKFWSKPKINHGDKISAAKLTPIDRFISFNRDGFAKCIWHVDNNPSMYYYRRTNRVYCFSCNKGGDSIDVFMQLNKVSLTEAIKSLT